MPSIDTRHSEMRGLMALLMIKHGDDIDRHIVHLMGSMEQDDVKTVEKHIEEWKRKKARNLSGDDASVGHTGSHTEHHS